MSRLRSLSVVVALGIALPALAQDDDLLAPLTPTAKPKAKAKAKAKAKPKATRPDDDLLAPLAPTKASVVVKLPSHLKGAKVMVDDREVSPGTPVEVGAGEHQVTAKRAGFADFAKKVTVPAGRTAEVAVTMEAVAGVLMLSVDQDGVTVLVDGSPRGETPMLELVLTPGSHEIVLRKEGYEDDSHRMTVRAGGQYPLLARMVPAGRGRTIVATEDRPQQVDLLSSEPSRNIIDATAPDRSRRGSVTPIYQRWYVWTGVAVVVAGAVGTGVVLANKRAPMPNESASGTCSTGGGGPCDQCIGNPAYCSAFRPTQPWPSF